MCCTRSVRAFKRISSLFSRKKGGGSRVTEIESVKLQKESLDLQGALLYQIVSARLEDKERNLRFRKEIEEILEEDRRYRMKRVRGGGNPL